MPKNLLGSYTGKPADRISFKLMGQGIDDAVRRPYISIAGVTGASILSCVTLTDGFIGFMLMRDFYFRFSDKCAVIIMRSVLAIL